jgi:Bacteriophage head to tail connecting protein
VNEAQVVATPTGFTSSVADDEATRIMKRFAQADMIRRQWVPLLNDCHQYAIPNRANFWQVSEAQRRTDLIFDSTAVISTQEFASRLQAGLTPNYTKWVDLLPGAAVHPDDRERVRQALAEINELFFELIHSSDFNSQSHECYTDLAIGTTALIVEEGDLDHPFKFTSIPLSDVWLEFGAFGRCNAIFRPLMVPADEIAEKWRDADLTNPTLRDALAKEPRRPMKLVEATMRQLGRRDTEASGYRVLIFPEGGAVKGPDSSILVRREFVGEGSNPWITARWSVSAGETYGRGPLISALPDIKTANMVVELILEASEMAISGLWQYEDDGVVNPETIDLVPGALIPHGQNTKGLEPLQSGGDFKLAFEVLAPLQASIKRALFDEMLGPVDKTPMSAAEVHVRMAEMARRIGSPYGRIMHEFVQPLVMRCLFILRKRGLIQLPRINKSYVKVVPTSPLARQQRYAAEVQAIEQILQIATQAFGPQMANLYFDAPKTLDRLTDDLAVPRQIIRSDADRKVLMQQIAQLAQAAQPQPQAGIPQQPGS